MVPLAEGCRRIVVIDGRNLHGEGILVVVQRQFLCFIDEAGQRRAFLVRMHRLVIDGQVTEDHLAGEFLR